MKKFLDKDFLLETAAAKKLYHEHAAKMPIIDYHCHINPQEIAENMKANGGFIPGIRPGKATEEYLQKVMSRITIVGAVFLAVIATLPTILSVIAPESLGSIHFGGTSLLIAVGVALETVRQLENQMLMRNYQGFLK